MSLLVLLGVGSKDSERGCRAPKGTSAEDVEGWASWQAVIYGLRLLHGQLARRISCRV